MQQTFLFVTTQNISGHIWLLSMNGATYFWLIITVIKNVVGMEGDLEHVLLL